MGHLSTFLFLVILFYTENKVAVVASNLMAEGLHWTGGDDNQIYHQNGTVTWITKHTLPSTFSRGVGYGFQRYIGLSYDYRRKYIVMSDKGAKTISLVAKYPDGSFKGVFVHVGTSSRVGHVAVDWLSGNVYWADSVFGWIGLQAIPTNILTIGFNDKFKAVVEKYLDIPSGIAVHPQKRFLFWSDIGKPARIERSNLDGSSRMTLIWLGIIRPISLTVDHANNILYWVDSVRSTVESCDFYGNNRKVLVTSFTSHFYGLAIYQSYVIVSDQAKKEIAVYSPNGDPVPNPVKTPNTPYSIAMFTIDNQPISSESCKTKGCEDICITTVTGSKCTCADGYKLDQDGLKCTVDTHALDKSFLISNASKVCAYPVTTVNNHANIQMNPNCDIASDGLQEINFIAPDTSRKILFLASKQSRAIYEQKLSDVHRKIYEGNNNINGLSYDWTTSELYWTEDNIGNIYSNVVETNSTFVISTLTRLIHISQLVRPRAITLEPLERRIFWIAGTQQVVIQTASLNKNQATITTLVQTGLSLPYKLTFSRRLNRLFWTDIFKIGRVAPDGTGISIKNVPNTFTYSGITTYKDYVLWLSKNSSGVYMNVEDLSDITAPVSDIFKLTNIPSSTEVQIFDNSIQPQIIEPCINNNGGCQHICIAEDFNSHCKCELGFTLHTDGKSCYSEPLHDNFFLTIDELSNRVYQIDRNTGNISALNIDRSNVPSAVALDYVTQKVIWCDSKSLKLKIANINGSEEKTLTTSGLTSQSRLAVDHATGNIYFSKGNAITVMSQDGKLQRNVVEGIQNAGTIAIHSKMGIMFWTEIGPTPSIKQSNMDGTSITTLVSYNQGNIRSPVDITVDTDGNALIWCDDRLDKIERINLITHESTILRSNAKDFPVAVAVENNYLFYIGNGRRTIIKIDKTDGKGAQNVVSSPLYDKLSSLDISQTTVSKHTLCSEQNGFCSRLCLPNGREKTCACPTGVNSKGDGRTCVGDVICPNDIIHGAFKSDCLRYEGHMCSYTCSDGYSVNHTISLVTCRSNGRWDVDTATLCSKVACLDNIANGNFDIQCGKRFGDSCSFQCDDGYEAGDQTRLTCQANGHWDADVVDICRVSVTNDGLSTGPLIGIAGGAVVFLIIIIFVVIICLMNKVRRERKDNHNPPAVSFTPDRSTKTLSESQRSDASMYSTLNGQQNHDYDQEIVYHEINDGLPNGDITGVAGKFVSEDLGQSKSSERYSVFPRNTNDDNMGYLSPSTVSIEKDSKDYLHLNTVNTPEVQRRTCHDSTYLHAFSDERTPSGYPAPDYLYTEIC